MQALKKPEIFDLHTLSNSVWLEDIEEISLWEEKFSGSSSTVFNPQEAVASLSVKARKVITKLKTFGRLSQNWDSYGAEPPSEHVVKNAILFVWLAGNDGLEPYFAGPGPNGEIMIEFRAGQMEAEVYFEHDDNDEVLIYRDGECILEGRIEETYEQLIEYFC